MGYHYPRSFSTAIKSAGYFKRFNQDYDFAILTKFDQVYATSANFSWSNAEQFMKFCHDAKIRCDEVPVSRYFKDGMCDGAFLTEEYTYDAQILKQYFLEKIKNYANVEIRYAARITQIEKNDFQIFYVFKEEGGKVSSAPFVLNSTYASVNQINRWLNFELFKIKYELCEIILTNVNVMLYFMCLTVMDGPFFSIMPFGKT